MIFFSSYQQRRSGYTLIEIVSALAAFTIIMLGVTQILGQSVKAYRETKKTQINLQGAQSMLNLMSKELRTSSIAGWSYTTSLSTIKFFDYSQSRCIEYALNQSTGQVTRRLADYVDPDPADNPNDEQLSYCIGYSFSGSAEVLLTGVTGQAIRVVNSSDNVSSPQVGKVTISLTLGQGSNQSSLQTTVSLRDFNYTGL